MEQTKHTLDLDLVYALVLRVSFFPSSSVKIR